MTKHRKRNLQSMIGFWEESDRATRRKKEEKIERKSVFRIVVLNTKTNEIKYYKMRYLLPFATSTHNNRQYIRFICNIHPRPNSHTNILNTLENNGKTQQAFVILWLCVCVRFFLHTLKQLCKFKRKKLHTTWLLFRNVALFYGRCLLLLKQKMIHT